jgi:UDP-glucose:(heptosyl)LPS alpha-1,3-glucosyltransferase
MKAYLTFPACHRRGGVERIMVECANFLAGRGHDVSVVAAQFDPEVLAENVQRIPVQVNAKNAILRAAAFRRSAKRQLATLRDGSPSVHASFGVVCPPDGVLWVQAVHAEWLKISGQHRDWKGRLKQRLNLFHPFILRLERQYYGDRQYRKLIALTARVRDELVEHYKVPESDIALLPNGYNPQEFSVARRESLRAPMRAELGYSDSDRVLIFVANELERKGFFPLIDALSRLKDPSIKLLVVGRVSLDAHQPLIDRLGLKGCVRCVGPSADVGRYYAAADLFVLPTYYEAWGLVIVEALAMGLPVVTSRLAGAAVAVSEGRAGLLLDDPQDAAEAAAKIDRQLRAAVVSSEEISATVQDYRWDRVLVQYERILQEHCR